LRPETAAWFVSVVGDYMLEPHHVRLLTLAGEAWDRCAEAREQLAREGLTVEGREGVKTHPAVAIERDSRAAFAALVKQLGLDDIEDPRRPGRPPSKTGILSYERQHGLPEPKPGKRARRRGRPNQVPGKWGNLLA
jgi:hypothetical protein